jgi:hypothetical protein
MNRPVKHEAERRDLETRDTVHIERLHSKHSADTSRHYLKQMGTPGKSKDKKWIEEVPLF